MITCGDCCTPICDHCIYVVHEKYKVNGAEVLGEPVACRLHPDRVFYMAGYCDDFHCFLADHKPLHAELVGKER